MTLKKINPTKTKSWKKLKTHFKEIENEEIKNLLSSRPSNEDFNLKWNDFNVDISKNRIDNTTLNLLIELANECDLKEMLFQNNLREIRLTKLKREQFYTLLLELMEMKK
tara:strand:+ start:343 stop:672 length:330 start_codon:yes stop_codon:yes gene_type:complete